VLRTVGRRLLWSVPLLIVVTFSTFWLSALAPGNLALTILNGQGTQQQYLALRAELGLNKPLLVQYWDWVRLAVRGNLGDSALTHQSVVSLLDERIWVTLSLLAGVLVVCVAVGISLGVFSALRGGVAGNAVDVLSMGGLIFPSFWVALVLILLLAVKLPIFPATGYTPFSASPWLWFLGIVLPVIALAFHGVTATSKQTRDAMRDVMNRDFIRALRASGVSSRSIIFKHALRNAAPPVISVLGVTIVGSLMGAVFVESAFVLPGLGSLAVQAASTHDVPVLQGVALYFTFITIICNLAVDLSYGWLNPKARTA